MATVEQVSRFRSNSDALVTLARNDLAQFWAAIDPQNTNPMIVRAALEDFFPELVQSYGDAAALLAADFYDELRDVPASAARFGAVLADVASTEQAQAVTRWGLGPLFQPEPVATLAFQHLSGAMQRLVLQPGRDTIARSAVSDPVRTGFARIPVGVTCRFCIMLASRGAVYGNAVLAGDSVKFHSDDDCTIVPVRSKADYPEGHNVEKFLELYARDEGVGRDVPAEASPVDGA